MIVDNKMGNNIFIYLMIFIGLIFVAFVVCREANLSNDTTIYNHTYLRGNQSL